MGRPFLYALGAAGEAGLHEVTRMLAEEVSLTMAQVGITRIADIDHGVLAEQEQRGPG